MLPAQYVVCGGKLFKRSPNGTHLLCVSKEAARILVAEVHVGVCGPHMNGRMLTKKLVRLGYFWSTMETDYVLYVKRCHQCQIYSNMQYTPPVELHQLTSPWPFSVWGIDIIGKIHPKATGGYEYILVAKDYFTKWVEAEAYTELKAKQVAQFIETNIICRYGVPHELVSDNRLHFEGETQELLDKYHIQHHHSSPYRLQTNGAVEAANKNVKSILVKSAKTHKDWAEKLPYALWGYRTSIRTSTGATPYSLVYGMEAVLPVELEVKSLRVMMENQIPEAEWIRGMYEQLALLDEKRLKALYHVQGYQRRIARAFNKRVRPRNLKEGDLVLKEVLARVSDPRGKFRPNWAGPYIVKTILSGGAVKIIDEEGNEFTHPVNMDRLHKYYI